MLDKNKIGYYNFEKYKVNDIKTIEEFLNKYSKTFNAREQEYHDAMLKSHTKDYEKYGFDIINRHDSITGECVAFYKD